MHCGGKRSAAASRAAAAGEGAGRAGRGCGAPSDCRSSLTEQRQAVRGASGEPHHPRGLLGAALRGWRRHRFWSCAGQVTNGPGEPAAPAGLAGVKLGLCARARSRLTLLRVRQRAPGCAMPRLRPRRSAGMSSPRARCPRAVTVAAADFSPHPAALMLLPKLPCGVLLQLLEFKPAYVLTRW